MMSSASTANSIEPVHIHNESGDGPALIVCEHASNFIPDHFENLGLSATERNSHIAWDLGAGKVAIELANILNSTCITGGVSRLIYDCNRPPDAVDAIPQISEIYTIPGNQDLPSQERDFRIHNIYTPFSDCLARFCARRAALVTIHSFTPVYRGIEREVELGILHDHDTTLADCMIGNSPKHTDMIVRRNEPYGPEHGVTHTLKAHGLANNIPNVMVEIRNDLIATPKACENMATMLAVLISQSLSAVLGADDTMEKRA